MSTRIDRILVALEGNADAERLVDEAADLATRDGAKLVLLRVIRPFALFAPSAMLATARLVTALEESASRELTALAARVPAGMIEDMIVHSGNPCETIRCIAELAGIDLIVMGTSRTSRRVVNHAPCNVLVMSEGDSCAA